MNDAPRGLLFVASDIDEQDDDDFNQWYDREHLEDRVRMPGVLAAARYVAVDGGPRYLALYWADTIGPFASPAYAHAFKNQTPWSLKVLPKMRTPVRRIGTLHAEIGKGSGGHLAILPLELPAAPAELIARCRELGKSLSTERGFVRSALLIPDDDLSRPLPLENLSTRKMQPIFLIESSHAAASDEALQRSATELAGSHKAAARYTLTWSLDARECA